MKTFGFTTALSYLMQGKKVRRQSWGRAKYARVIGEFIETDLGDDLFEYEESPCLLADDWELVAD